MKMKLILALTTIIAALSMLTGCSAIGKVKDGVDEICSMSAAKRDTLREEIDTITKPHTIRIHCNE